jgi:phospholipid-binding lipoprotein MlaA
MRFMVPSRTLSKPTACALVAAMLIVAPARSWAASPDDPWEPFNRSMYTVHRVLDAWIFGPAARAYKTVLPQPVRKGLRNVINNLKEPAIAFNDLIQAHPTRASHTAARFIVNSTAGIGGVMDIAYNLQLPHHDNGFGTTMGRWSIQPGPYLFIPFIGPTNLRDLLGQTADMATDPLGWDPFHDGEVIYARSIVDGLDVRAEADAQLKAIDDMSTDPYASLRSLYEQNRQGEIQEAITGVPGSAAPALDPLDDPGATTAPAPGQDQTKPPAAPSEPRAQLENDFFSAMLSRPLRSVRGDSLAAVESPRAG